MVVDPLAVGRAEMTPYHYVSNNPISRVDPDGRWDWYQSNATGTVKWFDGDEEQDGFRHIGSAGTVTSTVAGNVVGVVNLNADGTATDAKTGKNTGRSASGKTKIVEKEKEEPLWLTAVDLISGGDVSDMRASLDALGKDGTQSYLNTQIGSVVSHNGSTGFGPNVPPIRYEGPWTTGDLNRSNIGKGPLDFIPRVNSAGRGMQLELHHADQMPGSAIHEVAPAHTNYVPHLNIWNQGVTDKMRSQDTKLHWYMRGREMSGN